MHGIRANPKHYACTYNVACAYHKLNKHNNAIKWFSHACKLQNDNSDPYYGKALSFFKLSKYQEAYDCLN